MPESPAAMPTLEQARTWSDWEVDEIGGGRVGRAVGVFAEAEGGPPAWLIVKLGRRGPFVAVPLRDCAAGGGRVWVAHGKERIRSAPVVDPTRPLLREHELTICAHFGIGEKVGRAAEVAGRPESAVTSQPSL